MKTMKKIFLVILCSCTTVLFAQEPQQPQQPQKSSQLQKQDSAYNSATRKIFQKLQESNEELKQFRQQMAQELVPLNQELNLLESQLIDVRNEYQQTTRQLDSSTLKLNNLRNEIKSRKEDATYISSLLGEYIRNFESHLHIAEIQRYKDALETARLAAENNNLTDAEVYQAQAELLSIALDRLHESLGGATFEGEAVDPDGTIKSGTFAMIGPAVLFLSEDGTSVGTVEQRLNSAEPTIFPFEKDADTETAALLVQTGKGKFPFDPTLGNAHKIEETQESIIQHIQKGGPVMIPIFALAGVALLVALYKWVALSLVRKPSQDKLGDLLDSVARNDKETAQQKARSLGGPIGEMLTVGAEHLKHPRDLIEEVMYEKVMSTRLKLQRYLPFIAICAASAPLLGLLGTVTGIINTFKLITVFGSGDVKMLSGGISEALITTKFGLIVAIPALLLHAFLSRKANGIINQMEKAAVSFINEVSKNPAQQAASGGSQMPALSFEQAQELLRSIGNQPQPAGAGQNMTMPYAANSAGSLMTPGMISLTKNATVAEAINKIRTSGAGDDMDAIFVVDEQGKYVGHVLIRYLLTRPEDSQVASLTDKNQLFVRVDTHQNEITNLFHQHDLISIPVLDHEDKVVGRITRNGNNYNQ